MTKTISIEGMSCGHCTARVEKALKALSGITDLTVDLDKKIAVFSCDGVSDELIKETIEDSGYDVVSIE